MLFELNPQNSHLAQEITFFIIFEPKKRTFRTLKNLIFTAQNTPFRKNLQS